jgi:hypothetical protein
MGQLDPAGVENEETIEQLSGFAGELLGAIDEVAGNMAVVHLTALLWILEPSFSLNWVNNPIDSMLGHYIWNLLLLTTVLASTLLEHGLVGAQVLHHVLHRADMGVVLLHRLGVQVIVTPGALVVERNVVALLLGCQEFLTPMVQN